MDIDQRITLVRRIMTGKLYGEIDFSNNTFEIIITDPGGEIQVQSDWYYKRILNSYKNQGVFTIEESYQQLIRDGQWSQEDDEKVKTFEKDIKILESELKNVKFHKEKEKILTLSIEKAKDEIKNLTFKKNQLLLSTAEFLASLAKKRWLMAKCTQITNGNTDLLSIPNFLDNLVVYYYEKNYLPEKQIRELARTDPWRLYWIVSKNTGTPLFGGSSVDMTDLQYSLVFWSKLYDFAFESMDRPSHEIIADDEKFDHWYKTECERLEGELKKNKLKNTIDDAYGGGGSEVFIPADREGAKEVYDLNDLNAKNRITQRQKAIEIKKEVREEQLPDVKRDIQMEAVKAASAAK